MIPRSVDRLTFVDNPCTSQAYGAVYRAIGQLCDHAQDICLRNKEGLPGTWAGSERDPHHYSRGQSARVGRGERVLGSHSLDHASCVILLVTALSKS